MTTPAAAAAATPAPDRRRLISTSHGSRLGAFGPAEWGLVATTGLVWGSSFLWIEVGLDAFSPALIAFIRVALGAVTLAVLPKARVPIPRHDRGRVALLGVLWMAIPLVLFPVAQQWVDSSVAGMMNGSVPVFTAVVAAVLLRHRPGAVQIAGVVVGFGGVLAITAPSAVGAQANAVGVLLLLAAVGLYSVAANLAVPLQQAHGALPVTLQSQLVALVLLAPFAAAGLPSSEWAWDSALAMLPLGVLGSGVAFVTFTTLVGRTGALRGAVAVYFTPVVAIVLGVVVLDETVQVLALLGTALVIVGAWLTSRPEEAPPLAEPQSKAGSS